MTFLEFLTAMGKSEYRKLLENLNNISPLPEPLHAEFINLLKKYYYVGGMPEAVKYFLEQNDLHEVKKNLKMDDKIINFPLYAVSLHKRLLKIALRK